MKTFTLWLKRRVGTKKKPFYKWWDEDFNNIFERFFEKHGWYLMPIFLIPLVIVVILITIPYLISASSDKRER